MQRQFVPYRCVPQRKFLTLHLLDEVFLRDGLTLFWDRLVFRSVEDCGRLGIFVPIQVSVITHRNYTIQGRDTSIRDALSTRHILEGMYCPRDALSKEWNVQGTHSPRDETSKNFVWKHTDQDPHPHVIVYTYLRQEPRPTWKGRPLFSCFLF